MTELLERTWRDAKIPKWVMDSVKADLEGYQMTAALAWPTEAKPEPVPFHWGEYDRLTGEPVEGTYWSPSHRVTQVQIRRRTDKDEGWKPWLFCTDGTRWHSSVTRGPLYSTPRDAHLALLWRECERSAKHLKELRDKVYG